ncbi:hypothetical protein KFK09_001320 [Dendrobium nobile]|uniref:Uncharacterized protein n=1 Tax=Dendrobium nobile TaxID=94219 RepID=A0A8T3C6Y4_DENNO|nr:hypothetical protein KFK09_001320 [Dendrobium nobile]
MILGSLDLSRRATRFDYKHVMIGDRLVTQIVVRSFQKCFESLIWTHLGLD